MRKILLLCGLLSASGLHTCAIAQESLLIGAGDQLHVQVFDTPEMEQHPRVTDAGEIPMMFIGNVKVSGLTPAEAAHAIEDALKTKQYMLQPQVAVSVDSFATQDVTVMGQVHEPGTYDLTTPTPILKVLSMAGGITDSANRNITIDRHATPGQKVAYHLSNTADDALANQPTVYPGDIVIVPKASVVYVLGDVTRAGGFAMADNDSKMTLLQALSLAGLEHKTAMLSKAKLIRRSGTNITEVPVKISAIEKGEAPDVQLEANDIVFIPTSWMKTMIFNNAGIASAATSAVIYHP